MQAVTLIAPVLAFVLLAGCSEVGGWNKPGGNEQAFQQDSTACYRAATLQAERQTARWGGAAAPQLEVRNPQGRVRDSAQSARAAASLEQDAQRNRLYAECMHRLGYRRTG